MTRKPWLNPEGHLQFGIPGPRKKVKSFLYTLDPNNNNKIISPQRHEITI